MFAPRDSDEYLLDSERRVIRVRQHWACLAWDIFETIALLAVAVMVSYLLPPSLWLVQNILWYAALFVLLRFAYVVLFWWVERIVVTDKRMMKTTGIITTIVGGGSNPPGVGVATSMHFDNITEVAANGAGELFVATPLRVFKLNIATGMIAVKRSSAMPAAAADSTGSSRETARRTPPALTRAGPRQALRARGPRTPS